MLIRTIQITGFILITSCGSHDIHHNLVKASEVPSTHSDHAVLGQAYHLHKKRFLNVACVEGIVDETLGNSQASIELAVDRSFSDILDRLGGKLSVDVDFPVVRAGASASYAKEMAATEHTNTYHFSWSTTPKKKVLLPGTYRVSEVGRYFLDSYPNQIFTKCGNEFITSIEYGASLNVNLKMEFRNRKDKLEIGGRIKVDIGATDIVSVDGELGLLDEKVKKSVKITVQALQRGGDPLELLSIIPDNLITCTLENPAPCFKVFGEAISYAKNQIPDQFESFADYNVIKYTTNRYDESGLEELAPIDEPQLNFLVEEKRYEMDREFQAALLDKRRASRLRMIYREWLSDEQYTEIKDIEEKAGKNAWIYSKMSRFCYDNPYEGCLDYIFQSQPLILDYDRSNLDIEAPDLAVYFPCEKARSVAVKKSGVSLKFANAYKNKGWAPVFYDNTSPEKGVREWVDCEEAQVTYGDVFNNSLKG